MELLYCREILSATGGILISGKMEDTISNISTDTRQIAGGDFFIPIAGERFDGHDFIADAFREGASGCLTHRDLEGLDVPMEGRIIIRVEDTARALRDLASYYRSKFNIPVVGITGSVGKTSTKEMIACVLARKYNVLKTSRNLNNEIGLPLTVFNLNSSHEIAVFEMGMSALGEISRLTAIAKPSIAVISNIGISHIEKLGSKNNILKAKMEILEGLSDDGIVILNGDDDLLLGLKGLLRFRTIYYGMGEGMDYQAYNIRTGEKGTFFEIFLGNKEYTVEIKVPGVHNVYNALAAISTGMVMGIPPEDIIEGIAMFRSGDMRLDIKEYNGIKVINDVYNASPDSMQAALRVLKDVSAERRIAVLGDMLELGRWSEEAHRSVGRFAALCNPDYVIAVGNYSSFIIEGARENIKGKMETFALKNNEEAIELISSVIKAGDAVLVKGSRGMRMERIVERIKELSNKQD